MIAYVSEIAGRTEQYWCPIKHAMRLKAVHQCYGHFLEYGDAEQFHRRFERARHDFADVAPHRAQKAKRSAGGTA